VITGKSVGDNGRSEASRRVQRAAGKVDP
jgi:hypothetical protein